MDNKNIYKNTHVNNIAASLTLAISVYAVEKTQTNNTANLD